MSDNYLTVKVSKTNKDELMCLIKQAKDILQKIKEFETKCKVDYGADKR